MGNSIKFTDTKLWRKDFDDGTSAYSVGVSSKRQDGTYISTYRPVRFVKSLNAPKISNGTLVDLDGFLSAKEKKDGTTEDVIIVQRYAIKEQEVPAATDDDIPDNFEQAEMDIPF